MATDAAPAPIRSTIPARLDRLPWSKFHTRMVIGLGSAWVLDGLQITIASSVTGVLIQPDTLDMSSTEVGLIATVYLVGQVVGALVFGGSPISSGGSGCSSSRSSCTSSAPGLRRSR